MSEEREFEVIDKRRVQNPDAEETAESVSASDEPEPSTGEAVAFEASEAGADTSEGVSEAVPEITTRGFLWYAVYWLEERAWVAMGLRPDPMTGKVSRDLVDARLAIDVLTDLVKHAQAGAPPEMTRELQVMLSNLQVNYVRQASQG